MTSSKKAIDKKVFNDPIHDQIALHPLLVKIIDTPQFQRLRNIKQLGGAYFVYPGASHNRFEHSIGTAHLAGKLVRMLQKDQPELFITNEDVLCVEIAGLCHDLGHGPFSHMFDLQFIPRMRPGSDWKHEIQSCKMIDHLIKDNNLQEYLDEYGIADRDIIFVKEMIAGPLRKARGSKDSWPYEGRGKNKRFLYEIVSNERNKVDVDKWDYFARDCHYLGMQNSFNHNRLMHLIKVLPDEEGQLQICVRDKESYNLYEMFHTRDVLHRRAYKHKVANAIEAMICDAMVLAEPYLKFGVEGKTCTMPQCIDDPVAYTQLNDSIFDRIAFSTENNLKPAREILQRIFKRQLYQNVGTLSIAPPNDMLTEIAKQDENGILKVTDLILDKASFSYGMKKRNPVDFFNFYSKDNPGKAYAIQKDKISSMLPEHFEESEIRVLCKKDDDKVLKRARECFRKWCDKMKITPKEHTALVPAKRKGE